MYADITNDGSVNLIGMNTREAIELMEMIRSANVTMKRTVNVALRETGQLIEKR